MIGNGGQIYMNHEDAADRKCMSEAKCCASDDLSAMLLLTGNFYVKQAACQLFLFSKTYYFIFERFRQETIDNIHKHVMEHLAARNDFTARQRVDSVSWTLLMPLAISFPA